MTRRTRLLESIEEQLRELRHKTDVLEKVLIVKEPGTPVAAEAFDGLRKQVIASAGARRSHVVQLAEMATSVRRASSIHDVGAKLREWLRQAGVEELHDVPQGAHPQDLFEDVDGVGLAGADRLEIIEPAYVDTQMSVVIRLGRARRAVIEELREEPASAGDGEQLDDTADIGTDGVRRAETQANADEIKTQERI